MQFHIDRGGQRFGPYDAADVKKYLADGTLLGTDLGWRDGMAGWAPLSSIAELQGGGNAPPPPTPGPPPTPSATACPQCGTPSEPGQVICVGCGTRLGGVTASRGVRPVNPVVEERQKSKWVLVVGILLCVAFLMPVYTVMGDIVFPSFKFSGKKTLDVFNQMMPLICGATLCGIAFTTQAIARSIVLLSLGGVNLIVELANTGSTIPVGNSSVHIFLIFVGFTCYLMGALSRYYRPDSLTAFILATVGGAFICLFWLIPIEGMMGRDGSMMLIVAFKMFDISVALAIGMILMLGLSIAASVFCFINTPKQPVPKVQKFVRLSLIFMFSAVAAMTLMTILAPVLSSGGVEFGDKMKLALHQLTSALHATLAAVGMMMVLPLGGMDIFVGRADK